MGRYRTRITIGLGAFFSFFFACLLGCLAFLPYETLKSTIDRLSPDGNFESFTRPLLAGLRLPSILLGSIFFLILLGILLFPPRAARVVDHFYARSFSFNNILKKDLGQFWQELLSLRVTRLEGMLIGLITAGGLIPRAFLLNLPIEYDEAYTFIAFARRSFRAVLTNYDVPNNHVFHTLLVRLSYLIFGDQAWQVRLPVFIAGILLIPCIWLLGRMLHNKQVGLVAAGVVAFIPVLISRSVSARGYPLITLLTVLAFLAAGYCVRRKNLVGWSLFVIFCALGFYTVPVMLYPVGFLFTWMLFSIKDARALYTSWGWIKHLCVAGFLIVALSLLLYSPILLSNDLQTIYHNFNNIHPMSLKGFISSIPFEMNKIFSGWILSLPWLLVGLLAVGLAASVWLQIPGKGKYRASAQLALLHP